MMKLYLSSLTQVQGFKMKTPKYITLIFVTMITMVTMLTMANSALAQSTVLVIDQGRVLIDSDVGKHVKRQIASIGKQMEAEMKAQMTPVSSERASLLTELKGMGAEALQGRPD